MGISLETPKNWVEFSLDRECSSALYVARFHQTAPRGGYRGASAWQRRDCSKGRAHFRFAVALHRMLPLGDYSRRVSPARHGVTLETRFFPIPRSQMGDCPSNFPLSDSAVSLARRCHLGCKRAQSEWHANDLTNR